SSLLPLRESLPACHSPALNSRTFGCVGIELPLVHARNRHAGEHAGLRKRVTVHKRLGLGAALHVDDQQAADVAPAVVARRSAGNHQDVSLAFQIFDVGLQAFLAFLGEVWRGYTRYGKEHRNLLSWGVTDSS